MPYYRNETERIMLAALQVAVDDIARTAVTPELFPWDDPFRVERSAKILSVRVSQTILTAYAFTRVIRCSPEFLASVEALADLARQLVPDAAEGIDWDGEWAEMNGESA
jgi:hypothetical protein